MVSLVALLARLYMQETNKTPAFSKLGLEDIVS
ncbi:unnamed protein product, partial [marine sediment metagenome]